MEWGYFFTVTFKRTTSKQYDHLTGGGVNSEFNDRRERILLCLEKEGEKNINQLVVDLGIPKRTLEREISKMKKKGYLNFVGAPKTGGYILTRKGQKLAREIID